MGLRYLEDYKKVKNLTEPEVILTFKIGVYGQKWKGHLKKYVYYKPRKLNQILNFTALQPYITARRR